MVAIKDRLRELGLFAGLVAVTLTSLVWAFSTMGGLVTERNARAELLDTLKRIDPRASAASAGIFDQRDPYLAGESETIAAAGFQTRVRGLVENAGGTIFSTQAQSRSEGDEVERKIEVQVVFEATVEALQTVLHEVETGAPYGFVDDLSVLPAAQAGETSNDDRMLRVTLSVTSFWRRPA